ncbi:MAG TPA: hypothetical protein VF715_01305 [Thermoleophilaceae bacterium]|jgi:hypothetical protein
MAIDRSNIPHVTAPQVLVDRVEAALARLDDALEAGVGREVAVDRFMRTTAVAEAIRLAVDPGEHRVSGLSLRDLRRAVTSNVHAEITEENRPEPVTAFDVIGLAQVIATHMTEEADRVRTLAGTSPVNPKAEAEWKALAVIAGAPSESASEAAQDGAQEAMLAAFDAMLLATPESILRHYDLGVPADPDSYHYAEDVETWFTRLMVNCVRRAINDSRYSRGRSPLPPDDELGDEGDDDAEDGGLTSGFDDPPPPGSPGGGAVAAPASVRDEERERDLRRIESLRELVETAESVLAGKQRLALLTKLFSPRQREVRAVLVAICATVVREVPRKIADDEELAALIGSASATAAQRNYNHARQKLLKHACDDEQRREWSVILDSLLPRRSRGSVAGGSHR